MTAINWGTIGSIVEGTWAVKHVFLRVELPNSKSGLWFLVFGLEWHVRLMQRPQPKVQRPNFMEIRSILVPIDFSECGNYALSYAASLARTFGASIICVHVIEPMVPTVGYSGMTEPLPLADISGQLEDLIVVSSHGRTGLGRILFGSTAEAVVRHASCPVLVVKPAQEEEKS
jgi:hypothetical protein